MPFKYQQFLWLFLFANLIAACPIALEQVSNGAFQIVVYSAMASDDDNYDEDDDDEDDYDDDDGVTVTIEYVDQDRKNIKLRYSNGWREAVMGKVYTLIDPKGRRVAKRKSKSSDLKRLRKAARIKH